MENTTKKIQAICLNLLKEFDRICRKNNLKYFLDGGTLLGAVRHKGFIPWDDDIDVGMPRPDYERFVVLAQKELSENYGLITHKSHKNYPLSYAKLEDKRTLIREKNFSHLELNIGVNIDIFPFDGLSNNSVLRWIHFNKIVLIKRLVMLYYLSDTSIKEEKGHLAYLFGKFAKKTFRIEFLFNLLERRLKQYSYLKSDYICNFSGTYGKKGIIPKKWIGTLKEISFEGMYFKCMEFPEKYLAHIYGNYMRLPPVEERKSHSNQRDILKI